jgi:hypothetical protein
MFIKQDEGFKVAYVMQSHFLRIVRNCEVDPLYICVPACDLEGRRQNITYPCRCELPFILLSILKILYIFQIFHNEHAFVL